MYGPRTDLAIEAAALYNKTDEEISKIDGVKVETEEFGEIKVTHVEVTNKNGEKAIGKEVGNYITIECPGIRSGDEESVASATKILAEKLKKLLPPDKQGAILVVGLGNWHVTPDALGPKVVSGLKVTRHLFEYVPEYVDKDTQSVCAISPGVLGITGIETSEIIKGIVDMVKPHAIIAVDALASRRTNRISTTIQLADTGITPGSGVGNKRKGLNKEYLGVPVIAIGVPTVVDAATVANDAIELLIENIRASAKDGSVMSGIADTFDTEYRYPLIKEVLTPYVGDLIVTPKEVDGIIEEVSFIISDAVNTALFSTSD